MPRHLTRLAACTAQVFVLIAPRLALADPGAEAAVLQAEAMVREIDGDMEGALALLRQAYATSAEDRTIAFDLARVSIELLDDPPVSDLVPFLALEPQSDDERTLRAYILASGNDLAGAAEILRASPAGPGDGAPPPPAPEVDTPPPEDTDAGVNTDTGDAELDALRDELELYLEAQDAQTPDRLNLRLMVGAQGDSNVNLDNSLPASQRAGMRLVANGGLRTAPFESLPGLQGALTLDLGVHVVNREVLGAYDTATGMGQISFETDLGPLALYSEAYGLYVGAETFRSPFMYEVGGMAELRWPLTITPGVYVDASWRDYLDGNTDFNPGLNCGDQPQLGQPQFEERLVEWLTCQQTRAEGQDDRDGPRLTAGLLAEWLGEDLALSLRLGFQMENAQGPHQVQRGIDSALLFTWTLWRLDLIAGITVQWRRYPNWPGKRNDVRVMPQLDIGLSITDWLAVRASYFLIHNVSDAEPRIIDVVNGTKFEYTRHIGTLGLEGRY